MNYEGVDFTQYFLSFNYRVSVISILQLHRPPDIIFLAILNNRIHFCLRHISLRLHYWRFLSVEVQQVRRRLVIRNKRLRFLPRFRCYPVVVQLFGKAFLCPFV
uniref:Uncharacterized protein n=1 Tax=Cacopsylla melanoneura TaxID=428564 RepID=A0A8D9ENY9_9HEMI